MEEVVGSIPTSSTNILAESPERSERPAKGDAGPFLLGLTRSLTIHCHSKHFCRDQAVLVSAVIFQRGSAVVGAG